MNTVSVTLPYPPTVNHYWSHFILKGVARIGLSSKGKSYRDHVITIIKIKGFRPMTGRLRCKVVVHPPDNLRRDIENVCKPMLDAMQFGGMYLDDNQIDDLHVVRGDVIEGGKAVVTIEELPVAMPLFGSAESGA